MIYVMSPSNTVDLESPLTESMSLVGKQQYLKHRKLRIRLYTPKLTLLIVMYSIQDANKGGIFFENTIFHIATATSHGRDRWPYSTILVSKPLHNILFPKQEVGVSRVLGHSWDLVSTKLRRPDQTLQRTIPLGLTSSEKAARCNSRVLLRCAVFNIGFICIEEDMIRNHCLTHWLPKNINNADKHDISFKLHDQTIKPSSCFLTYDVQRCAILLNVKDWHM